MPKLKRTDAQKDRERMRRNLKILQTLENKTSDDMGLIINKSHGTWNNRLKNPDSLTWGEIRTLCTRFNVDIAVFCAGEIYQKGGSK